MLNVIINTTTAQHCTTVFPDGRVYDDSDWGSATRGHDARDEYSSLQARDVARLAQMGQGGAFLKVVSVTIGDAQWCFSKDERLTFASLVEAYSWVEQLAREKNLEIFHPHG